MLTGQQERPAWEIPRKEFARVVILDVTPLVSDPKIVMRIFWMRRNKKSIALQGAHYKALSSIQLGIDILTFGFGGAKIYRNVFVHDNLSFIMEVLRLLAEVWRV